MQIAEEEKLLSLIRDSLLEGQEGIKIRAFLAFNRSDPLVTVENLEALKAKGSIDIKEDTVYPVEIL